MFLNTEGARRCHPYPTIRRAPILFCSDTETGHIRQLLSHFLRFCAILAAASIFVCTLQKLVPFCLPNGIN